MEPSAIEQMSQKYAGVEWTKLLMILTAFEFTKAMFLTVLLYVRGDYAFQHCILCSLGKLAKGRYSTLRLGSRTTNVNLKALVQKIEILPNIQSGSLRGVYKRGLNVHVSPGHQNDKWRLCIQSCGADLQPYRKAASINITTPTAVTWPNSHSP